MIEKCPEVLWTDASYQNPFWRLAYHTLIYTHFYLSPREEDFVPWDKFQKDLQLLGREIPGTRIYSRAELLDFLTLVLDQVEIKVEALDLDTESGFDWLPFNKLELQFYNIRHIQQHTGELCERLGAHGEVEVAWVGRG